MQLVFDFVEVDDLRVGLADIWQSLNPQQRVALLTMLARLMARVVESEEVGDE